MSRALDTLYNMVEMTFRVCRLVWRGRIDQVRHYIRILEGYQLYLEQRARNQLESGGR